MGLSSSSTTSGPSAQAAPYLTGASTALQNATTGNAANSANISSGLNTAFSNLLNSSTNDPTTNAANAYDTNLLNSSYTQSPQLAGIIADNNNTVGNAVNSQFSMAGQSGSSRQTGELARQLSTTDNALSYADLQAQQARQTAAASNATSLGALNNNTASTLGSLGTTATAQPLLNASTQASGLGSLWGNSTTTTQNPNIFSLLMSGASQAASAAAKSGGLTMGMFGNSLQLDPATLAALGMTQQPGMGQAPSTAPPQPALQPPQMNANQMGMQGAPPPQVPQMNVPQMNGNMMGVQPKPSHSGFDWHQALGILSDGLAGLSGHEGTYGPAMDARRAQAFQLNKQGNQQALEFQRQLALAQYNKANPEPSAAIKDYQFITQTLGKDAGDNYLRNLGDPMVTVPLANGSVYSGPRSQVGASMGFAPQAGAPQIPTKPVGKLTPIAGGPMPTASGTFP